MPSPAWIETALAGNVLSGVAVPSRMRSIACASMPAWASAACAALRPMSDVTRRRNASLVDAGALHDPLVAGVDLTGEFVIGEDALRKVAAAAEHDRAGNRHEAAPPMARASPVPRT